MLKVQQEIVRALQRNNQLLLFIVNELMIDLLSTLLIHQVGVDPLHADDHFWLDGERVAYSQLLDADRWSIKRDNTDSDRGLDKPIHQPGSTVSRRHKNVSATSHKAKALAAAK